MVCPGSSDPASGDVAGSLRRPGSPHADTHQAASRYAHCRAQTHDTAGGAGSDPHDGGARHPNRCSQADGSAVHSHCGSATQGR